MTDGWREWQGLILTTAGHTTQPQAHHTHIISHVENFPQLAQETIRKPSVSTPSQSIPKQHGARAVRQLRGPTLSLCGVAVVEGLLALANGRREGQVGLHPLLAAVHHGLCGRGQ